MTKAKDGTVFLPLPVPLHRPIVGGCQCSYCKAHPTKTPMWDTLAGKTTKRHSWVVHFPECH